MKSYPALLLPLSSGARVFAGGLMAAGYFFH
jgi:hypothetical protein